MAHQRKYLVYLLILMLAFVGCSAKRRKTAGGKDSGELYGKALSRFNSGKYETALEDFQDVKNFYPESLEALRAEIKIADCHFYLSEYEEAVAIYEEFRKLHPYHEDIPYVLFQLGEAYFKQIRTVDRDPNPARNALSNFQYLVENYPPSIFTKTAQEKIAICREHLAGHEFLIGRFYYRKKKYQGAVARFEQVFVTYPDSEVAPKALFYMGKALLNLSLNDRAEATFREITHQYPNSEYASKAKTILQTQ